MRIKKIFTILIILIFTLNLTASLSASEPPEVLAEAAILIDSSSEKVLYSKNENEKMYPASTTKILTAILTIENCNLEDIVTVPYEAIASIPSGYSVAALQVGEQLTVDQLLQVLLVHSSNDAANVLAYHISNSIDGFASLMNNKVLELGLSNTHFTNPSGMHNENHYTTAHDLAIIMKYCMKNPVFRKLSNLKNCKIPATNKYEERVFSTTNELLIYDSRDVKSNYYYKYAIAGKTGYTSQAKNCLVSVSNKDGLELISVVLSVGLYPNSLSAKFVDTKTIFEYGYNNYTLRKLREQNAIAKQIEVKKGTKETKNLDLLLSNDITALISQDDMETEFSPEITIQENLVAPIAQNQVVGKITYNINDIEYSSDIVASHNVEKSSTFTFIIKIPVILIILFLLYKLLFSTASRNKKRRRNYKKSHRSKYNNNYRNHRKK